MKYVLIKNYGTEGSGMLLIDDPVAAYKSGQYQEENGDKLFQLGSEVKIEISIKPTSATRSKDSTLASSFPHGLKGGLDVGEYRG